MISALRTYRTLPALLAALMVLSVALPALCVMCVPVEAAAAKHTTIHATGHEAPMVCLNPAEAPPSDVDAPNRTSMCDDAACITVAEESAPAVLQAERMVLAVPEVPVPTTQVATRLVAVSSPRAHGLAERWASPQIHIPIRLRTASFLL